MPFLHSSRPRSGSRLLHEVAHSSRSSCSSPLQRNSLVGSRDGCCRVLRVHQQRSLEACSCGLCFRAYGVYACAAASFRFRQRPCIERHFSGRGPLCRALVEWSSPSSRSQADREQREHGLGVHVQGNQCHRPWRPNKRFTVKLYTGRQVVPNKDKVPLSLSACPWC